MSTTHYTQFCALARAAEIVGERWTLLIVRELLLGPKRFSDLHAKLDGISPTVLTGRLEALAESGIVAKSTLPAPLGVTVYELTAVGLALKPTIYELIRWGGHFLFPMRPDDTFEPDWVLLGLDAIARHTPTPPRKLLLRVKHKEKAASFLACGGKQGTSLTKGEAQSDAAIECRFDTLLRLISKDLPLEAAIAGELALVEGSMRAARALPLMFEISKRSQPH